MPDDLQLWMFVKFEGYLWSWYRLVKGRVTKFQCILLRMGGKRADEFIQAIRRIWTDEVVEFKAAYYNISASKKIGPKPIQKPHNPMYFGGFSPNTFSRIVNLAIGWFRTLRSASTTVDLFKDLASKAKKDPNSFTVILLTNLNLVKTKDSGGNLRFPMTGPIDEIASDMRKFRGIGIEHFIGFLFLVNLWGHRPDY